jgi:hypothetical protein
MLEKTESYTSIDIKELGQVSLRKTTRVTDDGTVISESHHREVRVSKVFVDDNEVEVATAREKQYFQRDATITDLPAHYQSAINAFWSGLPAIEEPVVEEEVPAEESGDDTEE